MDQYVPTSPPQFPITQLGTFKQDSAMKTKGQFYCNIFIISIQKRKCLFPLCLLWLSTFEVIQEHSRSTINDTTFLNPGLHTMDFPFSR
uniref:Uncharacterized protein n=1 Tax=Saimiri boliviensis boliviensis TaxID=39432 RepID=A0A2K6S1D2_SAIBB